MLALLCPLVAAHLDELGYLRVDKCNTYLVFKPVYRGASRTSFASSKIIHHGLSLLCVGQVTWHILLT